MTTSYQKRTISSEEFDVAEWHRGNLIRTLRSQLAQAQALGNTEWIATIQENLREALQPSPVQVETPEAREQAAIKRKLDALQQTILTKESQIAELTLKNQRLLDENAQLRANLAAIMKREAEGGFTFTPMGVFVMD